MNLNALASFSHAGGPRADVNIESTAIDDGGLNPDFDDDEQKRKNEMDEEIMWVGRSCIYIGGSSLPRIDIISISVVLQNTTSYLRMN